MKYYNEYPLSPDGNLVEIKNNNIESIINNRSIIGDTVYLNINNEVIGIKERRKELIVGILFLDSKTKYGVYENKQLYLFRPTNKNISDFYVPYNKYSLQKVYATIEFKKWDVTNKFPIGILKEIIGNIGEKDSEYENLRINHCVSNKVWKIENEKIKKDKIIIDSLNTKKEDYQIFSIDPIGSKDIDDAFHFTKFDIQDCKKYEVGIHIASPTHFFEKEDIHKIIGRVSTLYLPDKKYNMLPNIYADNFISLLENVNRYALSFIFDFDENGNILNFEIKDTIVKNIKNFNYDEFDETYLTNSNYNAFVEFSKLYFKDEHMNSHKLVEKWMIFANKKIAEFLILEKDKIENNIILRKHVQNLKTFNEETTISFETNYFGIDNEKMMNYLEYKKESSALYDIYNKDLEQTHSKLNNEYYTHVTSPIRRSVDFIIHLLLRNKEEIFEKEEMIRIINNINLFTKNSKKFYRNIRRLEYIFSIKNEIEKKITYGYIIKISKEKLKIYIPSIGLEEKIIIIPKKLEEITDILFLDNYKIKYKIENEIKEFNLYEKINVEVHVFIKNENFFDKLKIQIL
jgi:exoribonuclease R